MYPAVASGQDERPLATQPERPIRLTLVCWALALVGGALVVASAPQASVYRCFDGWTNLGQEQWFHAIAALVLTAPAVGWAAWLVIGHRGSARLRWAAAAVAVVVPVLTVALAVGFLPDPPATGTCGD